MAWSRFICAGLLTLGTFQAAAAQTACGSLDDISESVSLVRTIQANQGDRSRLDALLRLEPIVERLSAGTLVPTATRTLLPEESQSLRLYVENLQVALDGARAGHDALAGQVMADALNIGTGDAIRALGSHWDCAAVMDTASAMPDQMNSAGRISPGSAEGGLDSDRRAQAVAGLGTARDRSGERGFGGGGYYGHGAIVGGNSMVGLIVMGLVLLAIGLVLAWRHRTRQTTREARRSLNRDMPIRVDGDMREIRVIDISMNGAKLQHTDTLLGSEKIDILISGRWHAAMIQWHNPLFAGIMFRKPINEDMLAAIST